MDQHALMMIADETKAFHWVLLSVDGLAITPHSFAECEFDSYEAALNAGTLALAAADKEESENEAADPVGDWDCSESGQSGTPPQPVDREYAGR